MTRPSCSTPAARPGVSKGAQLLHRNIVANVLQSEAWYQPALKKLKPGEQLTVITALPLYHIFALTACAMLSARVGGHCVLIPNPRDIPGFVKELQKVQLQRASRRSTPCSTVC